MQPKRSYDRRAHDAGTLPHGQHHGRALSARRYVELARQPRLKELPVRPLPYLAWAATTAAFIFLFYLVLGGS